MARDDDELVGLESPGVRGRRNEQNRSQDANRDTAHTLLSLNASSRCPHVGGGRPAVRDCPRAAARCETLQIFSKNASQWRARPLPPEEIAAFRDAAKKTGIAPIVAHASYLINLATTSEALRAQSIAALGEEVDRAEALGLLGVVLHPGARLTAPTEQALSLISSALTAGAEGAAARKDDDSAGAHGRPGQHDGRVVRGNRGDARRREEPQATRRVPRHLSSARVRLRLVQRGRLPRDVRDIRARSSASIG